MRPPADSTKTNSIKIDTLVLKLDTFFNKRIEQNKQQEQVMNDILDKLKKLNRLDY